jgi:hypothetical protein
MGRGVPILLFYDALVAGVGPLSGDRSRSGRTTAYTSDQIMSSGVPILLFYAALVAGLGLSPVIGADQVGQLPTPLTKSCLVVFLYCCSMTL